jgi:hypothetical protein
MANLVKIDATVWKYIQKKRETFSFTDITGLAALSVKPIAMTGRMIKGWVAWRD